MLFAAATATSLLLPMTKLSRVYFSLRPLLFSVEDVLRDLIMEGFWFNPVEISRGRILGLTLDLTSKLMFLTVMLFLVRASVIMVRYLARSCLT